DALPISNPATGKRQLNLLSRSEEIAIGAEAMPELIASYGGEAPHAGAREYVSEIGMAMARRTEADFPDLPWEFTLLNSDVINAFALPGGKVFITRGLVQKMDNEAQMAAVLGHEVAHVTARHANEQISKQIGVGIVVVGASVAAGQSDSDLIKYGVPVVVGAAGTGFILKFGRDDELEADRLGMRYIAEAGYDPAAMIDVMRILDEASGGSAGQQMEMLSTHPLPQTRIDRARSRLSTGGYAPPPPGGYRTDADEFRRRMLQPLESLPPAPSPAPTETSGG
ncbi:MAG: M48 family metalloprotease, partial [Phycisphaerales bacterium]